MCVIIVKKAGVKLPKYQFLKSAAEANADGCGFATDKGAYFRTLDFAEFWREFNKQVSVDDNCVIHFRWATHGSVQISNCHPFAGYDEKIGDIYFAHNGVLPIDSVNNMTDSEICFRERLLPAIHESGYSTELSDEVSDIIGTSKFAFVDATGLHLFGNWINYCGLLLSNTNFFYRNTYRPVRRTTGTYRSSVTRNTQPVHIQEAQPANVYEDDFWTRLDSRR